MKLTDFKDLRVIKKSLSPEPEKAPVQNQPRKRSVFIHGVGDGILAVLLDCRYRLLFLNLQLDKSGLLCHSERSEESITN